MMPNPEARQSPLDRPLAVTFFTSFAASEKREQSMSLRGLVPRIKNTTHTLKAKLPWLKLAKFGDQRNPKDGVPTERQSLRHDRNVLTISGVEVDYDREIVAVDEAVAVLRAAGLSGMVYTSPSHTDDTPRWRVLCPLSSDQPPAIRTAMVARLNGLFQGALSSESFTLSQSYYYGSIRSNPSHRIALVDGAYLDERPDLDECAIGKPKAEYTPTPAPLVSRTENHSKFVEAVIRNALSKVRGAADGQKHHILRNQAMLLGGYQHAGGYSASEAVAWIMEALPASAKDRKAAATTALWGFEQGATKPIDIPDLPPRVVLNPEPPPLDPQDPGFDPAVSNVVQFPAGDEPIQEAPKGLPVVWFDDIEPILDARDFVQGVLAEQGSVVVYGESNAGKTFWTTDLGLHVAAGAEWNGRRVEQGGVIYCVLEGGAGFRNRVAAWRTDRGLKSIPFAAIPASLNLLNPDADTPRLVEAIKAAADKIEMPVKLVIVDTLSRAMAGGNENAPDDMGALVQNMDTIRAETGACVLFVHHSGKDQAKGARGHSLLRAAIDTEIEVVAFETSDDKAATVVKQREMKKGDVFNFTLKVVELGENRHGEKVTTCLVEPQEAGQQTGQNGTKKSPKLSPGATLGVRALSNAMGKSGAILPPLPDYPSDTVAVTAIGWREEYYQLKGASPDSNKHAFSRAETELLASNVITQRNGFVWFVNRKEDRR